MRRCSLCCLLALLCAGTSDLSAQTRRIAHASHSGAGTAIEEDNFGETPAMREYARRRGDSVLKATEAAAVQRAADSAKQAKPMKRLKRRDTKK